MLKGPIEQQILAAGNLSEAQVEVNPAAFSAARGRRFGKLRLPWVWRAETVCFWRYRNDTTIRCSTSGSTSARFSRELVVGDQLFEHCCRISSVFSCSALATCLLSQGKNVFAVIGPHARVSVTYFAANLALSFAQMAVPTLPVDFEPDKETRVLASLFGVGPKTEGLVEALTHGDAELPGRSPSISCRALSRLVAGATAPHPQESLSSTEFLTPSENAQRNDGAAVHPIPPALESLDAYVVASVLARRSSRPRRHRTKTRDAQQNLEGAGGLPARYRRHGPRALLSACVRPRERRRAYGLRERSGRPVEHSGSARSPETWSLAQETRLPPGPRQEHDAPGRINRRRRENREWRVVSRVRDLIGSRASHPPTSLRRDQTDQDCIMRRIQVISFVVAALLAASETRRTSTGSF